jgi:hypothetical protein
VEGGNSDSPAGKKSIVSPASNSTGLSSEQFLTVSTRLLDRVESAITKLKDCNDGLEVTRIAPSYSNNHDMSNETEKHENSEQSDEQHQGQLSIQIKPAGDLFWGGGTYLLTVHLDNNKSGGFVTLRSPLSGTFTYIWNASTREWIGDEDGHSLLGMLIRDWIRQCSGVPDF